MPIDRAKIHPFVLCIIATGCTVTPTQPTTTSPSPIDKLHAANQQAIDYYCAKPYAQRQQEIANLRSNEGVAAGVAVTAAAKNPVAGTATNSVVSSLPAAIKCLGDP